MALMAPTKIARDDVCDLALPLVVGQARDAEGGEPVEDRGAQGMAGREVGDVVEADVVDVEDRAHQCPQVDRLRRGEVLERPFHREAEGAEREEQREIATAVGKGKETQHGEAECHEPAAAQGTDADDQDLERWQVGLDPAVRLPAARSSSATPRGP